MEWLAASALTRPPPRPIPCSVPASLSNTTGRHGASRPRRAGSGHSLLTSMSLCSSSRADCLCCRRSSTTTARCAVHLQRTCSAYAGTRRAHAVLTRACAVHLQWQHLRQVLALLRQHAAGANPPNAVHRLGVGTCGSGLQTVFRMAYTVRTSLLPALPSRLRWSSFSGLDDAGSGT